MEIRTKIHTIYMLVGSTECGKTTFAREVLIPQLRFQDESRALKANVQYLSSDSIRQEILGFEYDKYDQVMLEASEQAFQLLFARLKMATSFPVNAEFVVVDTTGLAEDFRAAVREIAHDHNYNLEVILFDYRKREDYYSSERSKKLITSHINRLRKEVLGSLGREGYAKVHKIRAKDFYLPAEERTNEAYKIVVDDQAEYRAAILPQEHKYIVVGDVHECAGELKGLLMDYGFGIEGSRLIAAGRMQGTKIILVGDWIDKGRNTRETVEFLYENREHFLLVLGNHENFVYKYLRGEISGIDRELLHTYFDSTQVLAGDPELLAKFNALVERSKPFYRLIGVQGPSFFVTHAPCRNKYIGKLDTNSARHQRNFRIDRSAPLEEQLAFLQEEAVKNHPLHIFGHVAAKQAFRIRNKLHLDTGSVQGNALTSVSITYKPVYKSRRAGGTALHEELQTLFQQERNVSLHDLDAEDLRRLNYCSRNRINFISGTMSPADKDEAAGELESLRRGLDYYKEHGVTEVVLQPKYMGSRCNVYLHRDPAGSYAVSRNGYKIVGVDLTPVYEKLLDKLGAYMEENDLAVLILDGELLPWRVLGEGLIDKQFRPIEKALETELAFLETSGFEQAFGQLAQAYRESGFEQDQFHLNKSALSEKYGSSVYQNYKNLRGILENKVSLAGHRAAYETYKKQLDLYAGDGELAYKPFAVLKMICTDGREEMPIWKTSDMYRFLSEDEALRLDLTSPDSYEQARAYFAKLTTENGMEGVVIKPEQAVEDAARSKVVPYMKVRNAEYMSIIYGYDYRFPHKYSKLMKQKSIRQKLRTSLNEHRLGQRMLQIPLADIAPSHEGYKQAAADLLFEVAQEKEIDPRL
ncbi:metallophosphoesterase [Paenibacillus lutrae]|uniref:Metallophosphoesterase n=1 Tax=Paenibacillus lutrae TaxID=2078573 RepID=A0A7X3FK96_9BACL|nr:metallophosphoesterase [Paenibacillus lutrae]